MKSVFQVDVIIFKWFGGVWGGFVVVFKIFF